MWGRYWGIILYKEPYGDIIQYGSTATGTRRVPIVNYHKFKFFTCNLSLLQTTNYLNYLMYQIKLKSIHLRLEQVIIRGLRAVQFLNFSGVVKIELPYLIFDV